MEIGKYRVLTRIGRGAMGEVFRAEDTVLNRPVAIKMIAPDSAVSSEESLILRFRGEAVAAASLNHPNIVTVFDFGECDGKFFMAMELLEGDDLSAVTRGGDRPLDEKLALMEQITDAVAFAHAKGVVHRDLKPANIHILPNGLVKILDFGLARFVGADRTTSRAVLGTPYYMSPEQVRSEAVDERSDVFSLGSLFYELLTGRRPFPAETVHAVLFQVIQREPEAASQLNPEIPQSLDVLIQKAMAKEPERRFANGRELGEALRRVRAVRSGELGEDDVLKWLAEPVTQAPAPAPAPSRAFTGSAIRSPGSSRGPASSTPPSASGAPSASATTPGLRPVRVTFLREAGGDKAIHLPDPASTLLQAALQNGIPHYNECGGRARCSTCRVRIVQGPKNVTPRTGEEKKLAARFGWGDEIRLACQTRATGDVSVERLIHDSEDVGLLLPESQGPPPQEMALAAMSCNLRDFGPFAKRYTPYDVVHVLGRYFLEMGDPILANAGTIEKYLGHEIVAFFGFDGGDARKKCTNAVRAALRMKARMEGLNVYLKNHFGTTFQLGIGLHFGRMIVARVGHPSKLQQVAIGDTTAVARSVNSRNAENGTTILATEEFLNVVEDDVDMRQVMNEDVASDGRSYNLYEIHDFRKADAAYIVQTTFERVNARRAEAGTLFYKLLFEIDPSTKPLFSGPDMQVQGDMLMSMIGAAVKGLDNMDTLIPVVENLGRRHAGYGVALSHYDSVEQCLLETIRQMIGEDFTMDVRLAWTRIYNQLASVMIGAAQQIN